MSDHRENYLLSVHQEIFIRKRTQMLTKCRLLVNELKPIVIIKPVLGQFLG